MATIMTYLIVGTLLILVVNSAKGWFNNFTFFYGLGTFILLAGIGFMPPFPAQLHFYLVIFNSFVIISLIAVRGSVGVAGAVIQMAFVYFLIMAWFR